MPIPVRNRPAQTYPNRIHIVGGPGTGKSTLAELLSQRLELPLHEIEAIAYAHGSRPDFQLRAPLAFRRAEVAEIAKQPRWITEGTFLGWTNELFDAADVVIWLDLPWRLAAWRMVRRYLNEFGEGEPGARALMHRVARPRVRQFVAFWLWARRYYAQRLARQLVLTDNVHDLSRSATAAFLTGHFAKVTRCSRVADVECLVTSLNRSGAHPG